MRSAKRLSAAAVITTAVVALSACAGGEVAPAEASIDLRMTIWTSNEDHLALFDSVAEAYKVDHPEIGKIAFDPLPTEDYTSTVTTQVAGGNAPDLAWIFENAAADFVDSGALMPLNETLEATEGYDLDDIAPATTELWTADDQLMAYPFSTSPFVVFVNNDLLAEADQAAGAELAAGDWTWESVNKVGAAVNEATGKAGFVIRDFDYVGWDYLSTVWNGWGAEPWSADGKECTFASPEMVEAFEFLHDAAFESKSMPGPGTTADFFAGEAAITVTQISRASLLAEAGFEWDLLPLPAGPAGEYSVIGQAGIGVMAQGENAEAAAEFLAFFTNAENSKQLAQYFPPPRASQLNVEILSAANPLLTSEQIEDVVVPGIESGVVKPSHVGAAELAQEVRAALDELWTEDADVAASLANTCSAISGLIEG